MYHLVKVREIFSSVQQLQKFNFLSMIGLELDLHQMRVKIM